ncbi:MAG: DUF4830 domain-containing protein [Oscillospiraceae bacterium]|nr:DUF4830 domain-containing protein [Oscillospiraceae bacterium]
MRKTSRINNKLILLILLFSLATLFIIRSAVVRGSGLPKVTGIPDIVIFLSSFGWEVEPEPVTTKNVQIPAKFSPVYERYNELQKKQGFDLSRSRADIVESYTFRVLNHPVGTDNDVFANVLVSRGRIIGGDICSFAVEGFMTSFDGLTHN